MSEPVTPNSTTTSPLPGLNPSGAGVGFSVPGFDDALRQFINAQTGQAPWGQLGLSRVSVGNIASLSPAAGVDLAEAFKLLATGTTAAGEEGAPEQTEIAAMQTPVEEISQELLVDEPINPLDATAPAGQPVAEKVPASSENPKDPTGEALTALPTVAVDTDGDTDADAQARRDSDKDLDITVEVKVKGNGEVNNDQLPVPTEVQVPHAAVAEAQTAANGADEDEIESVDEAVAAATDDLNDTGDALRRVADHNNVATQQTVYKAAQFEVLTSRQETPDPADTMDFRSIGQSQAPRDTPPGQAAGGTNFQTLMLNTPLQKETWGEAFGTRILWMAKHETQGAELRLNPPHLGHINVRISINDDQAHVTFTSQHASVRDAVEAALPRLREMLADSGLNLANVDVSSQQGGFGRQMADQSFRDGRLNGAVMPDYTGEMDDEDLAHNAVVYASDGLVDYFA